MVARLEAVGVLVLDLTIDIIIAAKTRAARANRQATKKAKAIQNISRRSPLVITIQNWFKHRITENSVRN